MGNLNKLYKLRIRKIHFHNFRNIVDGEIDIPGGKLTEFCNGEPSILGLYGQNGSGKTSVILALNALKTALSGDPLLYPVFASCIRAGCNETNLDFEISGFNDDGDTIDIYYSFSLSLQFEENDNTEIQPEDETTEALDAFFSATAKSKILNIIKPKDKQIILSNEILQYSERKADGSTTNKQILIDTSEKTIRSTGLPFGNKVKYQQLTKNCGTDIDKKLSEWKIESKIKSSSFIFNENVIRVLTQGTSNMVYSAILNSLSRYANGYFYIIGMMDTAYNGMNVLPLSLWLNFSDDAVVTTLPLSLHEGSHCEVVEILYDYFLKSLRNISAVVSKIVPGLEIDVVDYGKRAVSEETEVHMFDLVSVRNGTKIPLGYESDGVRRIVSFLSLLIGVFNNESVTVAIDEIDSGIFEYLLGVLFAIMKESAKGQLIFTSHNLRPLEVLPLKNLVFTTINPENRFAKLDGISGNNNLRDSYFRNIILGTGKNAYYDSTDSFEIEQAFFEAGQNNLDK